MTAPVADTADRDLAADAVISRSPSVIASEVDGELLMMSIDQGRYFSLNDCAADIWRRLARPRPVGRLVDDLVAEHDDGAEVIRGDVHRFLRDLSKRGVVVLDEPPS